MAEPKVSGVECVQVRDLALTQVAAPRLRPDHRRERDRLWAEAVRANSGLWDAPAVACVRLGLSGPGHAVLAWAQVPYRNIVLKRIPGAPVLSSVFVTVLQPIRSGGVLVGRMSRQTASPGRWQLPGGTLEPPRPGEWLDEAALAAHAALELVEETGIEVDPVDLRLHAVTRGGRGNIGVHWLAPAIAEEDARQRFGGLVEAEAAQGRTPEFQEITIVGSVRETPGLPGERADYLDAVLARLPDVAIP